MKPSDAFGPQQHDLAAQMKNLAVIEHRVAASMVPKREVEVYGKHQADFYAKFGKPPANDNEAKPTWRRPGVRGSQAHTPAPSQAQSGQHQTAAQRFANAGGAKSPAQGQAQRGPSRSR